MGPPDGWLGEAPGVFRMWVGQGMVVPSKHAERKQPQTTGLTAADPGAQPPFLWCAPRLVCLAPSTSATPLRLGGQAAMQRVAQGIARGVAMSMQTDRKSVG